MGRAEDGAAGCSGHVHGWRGGATPGRPICDQEVASSIPGQGAAAYDDSGQVVHTHVPGRRQSSLLQGLVKPGTRYLGALAMSTSAVTVAGSWQNL